MGTNIGDFIKEAHRILKPYGIIKIAEVRSRFFEAGKDGIKVFTRIIKRAGFDLEERSTPNKMFFMLECKKTDRPPDIDESFSAKPCVYKKR
jgi:ribosomal RNA-processing protein 8